MSHVFGLDASRAISDAPTGTEGYSKHLIQALLPYLSAAQVRLYFRTLSPTSEREWLPWPANVTARVMPFPRLWTHARLAWEMACHPPDVLFVPAHVLPPVRPRKTLVTIHDLGYRYFPEAHTWRQCWYLDTSTRWNARVASHILADSQATREALAQNYGTPKEKITVVYPGYDAALRPVQAPEVLAEVRARYQIPGDYILYLGRVQPRKNLARLVRACAPLLARVYDLTLVLAGPMGWLASPIKEQVKTLGLEQRVRFPGYIAESDKAALLSGARVFAYPSLYEGFGFPVLEAQACGVPLLTSTSSSLPEVAGDGALLVDPLDEAALTAGLVRVLEDEALRQDLSARGRANLRRFSWDTAAQTVADVLHALACEA